MLQNRESVWYHLVQCGMTWKQEGQYGSKKYMDLSPDLSYNIVEQIERLE